MYLKTIYGTSKIQNWFYRFVKYVNSNFIGNLKNCKFRTKNYFLIYSKKVFWCNKKLKNIFIYTKKIQNKV